ncbi:uncharacterized protein LOC117801570 isoform X2 [Ailuropoda melanoleuca]|uniref:uncharacterized protein LOC117801570 isoform X2 n=1 Tax=Ailuropoda melanoleuca TaxID=9646 RepID=UPI0014949254|nr:uncharacterized protein LOC117801570 isoform X2 [Ailuropoda melanoleuca]
MPSLGRVRRRDGQTPEEGRMKPGDAKPTGAREARDRSEKAGWEGGGSCDELAGTGGLGRRLGQTRPRASTSSLQPAAAGRSAGRVARTAGLRCGPPAPTASPWAAPGVPRVPSPGARRNPQQWTQEPAAAEPRATGSEKRRPEPANEPEVQAVPFLVLCLERAGFWEQFLSEPAGISRLPASPAPSLRNMKQKENPGNSLPCLSRVDHSSCLLLGVPLRVWKSPASFPYSFLPFRELIECHDIRREESGL